MFSISSFKNVLKLNLTISGVLTIPHEPSLKFIFKNRKALYKVGERNGEERGMGCLEFTRFHLHFNNAFELHINPLMDRWVKTGGTVREREKGHLSSARELDDLSRFLALQSVHLSSEW